jgi:hypothetical protein
MPRRSNYHGCQVLLALVEIVFFENARLLGVKNEMSMFLTPLKLRPEMINVCTYFPILCLALDLLPFRVLFCPLCPVFPFLD